MGATSGAQPHAAQVAVTVAPLRVTVTGVSAGAVTVRFPELRVRVPPPVAVDRPVSVTEPTPCSRETATTLSSGTAS